MHRRDFIKMLSLFGLGSALPFSSLLSFGARAAWAAGRPALPIPGLLAPDAGGRIALTIAEGRTLWNKIPTRTWGFNGPLLGPALSLRRGQKLNLEVRNNLSEDTAVHWHGLEVPGISDGGPQAVIEAGAVWRPELSIEQRAATCWYHPHPHAKTGRHVAMGLAGFVIVEDEDSAALPLPRTWGVDDVPVVLQDKRLDERDQIAYAVDMVSAAVGWFGDFLLANGAVYPEHVAPRGWLRLRLLNGCNARSLRLAFSDNRPIYVIASDGGFLSEPVKVAELPIYMAERFEIMVDVSDGKAVDLLSLPVRQMGMSLPPFDRPLPVLRITPSQQSGHKTLPESLVSLPALPDLEGLPVRRFQLGMDSRLDSEGMRELRRRYGDAAMAGMAGMGGMGMMPGGHMMDGHGRGMMGEQGGGMMGEPGGGMMGEQGGGMMGEQARGPFNLWHANFINGKAFAMNTVSFDVKMGRYERWFISPAMRDMMLHPFHIHGTQFRILRESGAAVPRHRQGFKDTTLVYGGESEVLVRFMHPAPAMRMYMAHCHLLEHEDTGMMLSFTVTP